MKDQLTKAVKETGYSEDVAKYIIDAAEFFEREIDTSFIEECRLTLNKCKQNNETEEDAMQIVDINVFHESSLLCDIPCTPIGKDIICKTCKYKWEDLHFEGMEPIEQYTKGLCHIFGEPDGKPRGILHKGEKCDYYELEGERGENDYAKGKCPICGEAQTLPNELAEATCNYCGHKFIVEAAVAYASYDAKKLSDEDRNEIKNSIINLLAEKQKATAKEMEKKTGINKHKINKVLYADDAFVKIENNKWKLKKQFSVGLLKHEEVENYVYYIWGHFDPNIITPLRIHDISGS